MINPVELFSDTRAVLGTAVAMLGLAFVRYGLSRQTPAVTWLALSSAFYGSGQLIIRMTELGWEVSNPLNGWLGVGIGLPSLAGFVAGTTALLVRQYTGWSAFLGVLIGLPLVFNLLRWALGPVPYLWQGLVTLVFIGLAAWALRGSRELDLMSRAGLAAVLFLYPAAVLYSYFSDVPVHDFRRLSIVAVSLKFFYLMTLILKLDARLLLGELQGRIEAQTALQSLAATLEDKVTERTRQLQAINQGLQSFAGMVSHDLRGPVRNIAGLARVAKECLHDNDLAAVGSTVGKIEQEAQRASSMTTDLLALAAADRGCVEKRTVDMQDLANCVVAQLAVQFPRAAEVIRVTELPAVHANRELMAHVLTNLLSNALKYGAERVDLSINLSAVNENDFCRFSVTDNGPGFDPSRAAELFKPFSRLDNKNAPGTGLGLTVVLKTVEAHGGEVGAESIPGQGARFWWTIPATVQTPSKDADEYSHGPSSSTDRQGISFQVESRSA